MPRAGTCFALLCLLLLPAAAAFAQPDEGVSPSGRPWSEAVAELDGQAITRGELARFLIDNMGEQWLRALVVPLALRQEAEARGVSVAPEEVEARLEADMQRQLEELALQRNMSMDAFGQALSEGGFTMEDIRAEWRRMRAKAVEEEILAEKVVKDRIEIPESRIREAYEERHGARLRVRHIEVGTVAAAMDALQALNRGASFERLAEETTLDRQSRAHNYELLPPPAPDSAVGRRAASLRPGQRAIVRDGERVHVIELIERSDGGEVPYEAAREGLLGELVAEEAQRKRATLIPRLLESGHVRIVLGEAPTAWDAPVAHVGDRDILRGELAEGLIQHFGRNYLLALMRLMVVRREAEKQGVQLDPGEASSSARRLADRLLQAEANAMGLEEWEEFDALLRERGTNLEERREGLAKERLPIVIARLLGEAVLRQETEVTDEEVRAEFRRRHDARSRARQVVVESRAEAERALELLGQGARFSELAESVSLDTVSARQGGAFEVRREGLLGETLAEMEKGERRILQIGRWWHLVEKVEDIPARPGDFEELREQIREELLHQKAAKEYEFWVAELEAKAEIELHLE